MYRTVFNEYGEPMGTEYEMDGYEREIADWEEQMEMADDPIYASHKESEKWYQRALNAFHNEGVEVPYDVVCSLSRELRRKQAEEDKEKALAELKPLAEMLNEMGYSCECRYEYPTPVEYGSAYITIIEKRDGNDTPEEWDKVVKAFYEKGICIEDYLE